MKDFILHRRHALSKDKCESIIDYFETHKEFQFLGTSGERIEVDPSQKISTEMVFSFEKGPTWNYVIRHSDVSSIFVEVLKEALNDYKKQYPFIDKGLSPWTVDPFFKVQKYNPNEGFFVLHCENTSPLEDSKRILAWMIYLNDVTDGGHTEFPSQNKKFQPRRGDILLWPAYFTHPHRGITSKSQTKYIITGWYSFG